MMLRPPGRKTITLFILPLACLVTRQATAQEKPVKDLPPISVRDFTIPPSPAVDSNSSAVIIANFGDIRFIGNKSSWFSHVFSVHKRVKILNKKAFDAATVRVDLYTPGQDEEKLDRLTATTYNLENGQLSEIKLDKKDIFSDRIDKNYSEVKWTMPAVKEGSIIDYSYEITSNYNMLLPTWRFQSDRFPCLWSELQVDIPQTLMYVMVKQGMHPYSVDKGSEASESFRMSTKEGGWMVVDATTERHHWVMKDIPAFQQEPF